MKTKWSILILAFICFEVFGQDIQTSATKIISTYIIKDTHHDDYYRGRGVWNRDKNKAQTMPFEEASRLADSLQYTDDEYADPAPIEVEIFPMPENRITYPDTALIEFYPAASMLVAFDFNGEVSKHLLTLLTQYEKECYADSIKRDRLSEGYFFMHTKFMIVGDSVYEGKIDSSIVYSYYGGSITSSPRFYWYHKPTSFEGFIAWLRKQSKEAK